MTSTDARQRLARPERPGGANRLRPGVLGPVLAAPVGGLLCYLASAPNSSWFLAPLGLALLGLALYGHRGRVGLGLGFLFGLGYFVPLLPWIGIYVGPLPWLALAVLEALFLGVGSALISIVSRRSWWPVWAAALWVATEAASSRVPFGGFPWGRLAFTQDDGPFVRLAALGGTPLVGFAVALTGFGVAELGRRALAVRRPGSPRTASMPVLVAAGCVILPMLVAVLAPTWLTGATDSPERTVTVAAVQGNVPRLGLDFNAQRRAVLDYHVRRTLQLADDVAANRVPRPDLVIWPENSSDIDPLRNPDAYAEISAATDRIGAPILVGAVLVQPDDQHTTNSALVWRPGIGPVERNDKRRVEPFGEYLPWRGFFRLFSAYADRAGYFVPGTGPGVVTMAGVPVGVAICWEVAFDDLVNDSVRNGAQLLAVPSNNATFGHSDMTYQQLAISRLRAVEHDRAVVVAATSGESAIIAPNGAVLARSALFTPAALVERVPLLRGTTVATRLGALPEWLLTVVGLAAVVATLALGRRVAVRPPAGDERQDEAVHER